MHHRWTHPLAALVLVAAPVAFAGPDHEVRALHEEIAALKLDHALNLTRDQARAMLPLLRARVADMEQMHQAREQARPALVAALTQARDELKANGVVSDQTEKALQAAHGSDFAQMREKGMQFHQQAKQILTPQQLEAVKALKLGPGHPMGGAPMGEGGFGGASEGQPHPMMKGMFLHHLATSPAFLALVEARAR